MFDGCFWEYIKEAKRRRGERWVVVKCACGTKKEMRFSYLRDGVSKSCGCRKGYLVSKAMTTHGLSRSKTYNTWSMMIQRCCNKNHVAFHNYGERGITVCERWRVFENFLKDMGERPDGLELDRKNNSRGYEKSNCHWVVRRKNAQNSRHSKSWIIDGNEYPSARQAAEEIGVSVLTIRRWCNGGKVHGVFVERKNNCWSIQKTRSEQ